MNYEPDHYLYGKTDEQITTLAQSAIDIYGKPSGRDTDVYERCAVIHELKRLTLANETKREAIINRNERIAELKSTHPSEDWLTRAIATAGAPEGSNWDGLLEHVGEIAGDSRRFHVMRPSAIAAHEIAGTGPSLVESVRKLRERAEAAEVKSNANAALVAGVVRYFGDNSDVERCGNLAKMVSKHIDGIMADDAKTIARWRDRAESAEQLAESRLYELSNPTDTPTQPLDRIAADVSRIVALLEEKIEPCPKS